MSSRHTPFSVAFTTNIAESNIRYTHVYADSAYRSAETEAKHDERGFRSRIHSRASRNHPLSDAQVEANRKKSKVRVRIEHVFGAKENAPGGRIIRTIGEMRASVCRTSFTMCVGS